MKILAPIVSIEISQKCNLACAHCMRGEPENISITKDILNSFFDEVKGGKALVISGGEPFICYDEIKEVMEVIKQKEVLFGGVIIVTNGTVYDERIYSLLENNFEIIQICVSHDKYHLESIEKLYDEDRISNNPSLNPLNFEEVLDNLKRHINSPYFDEFYQEHEYLINMGRTLELDVPKKELDLLGYFYSDLLDEILLVGPEIYLDSLGYITDGNTSYDKREELSIGNIKNSSLYNMVINNTIRIECRNVEEFLASMNKRTEEYSHYAGNKYVYKNNKVMLKK